VSLPTKFESGTVFIYTILGQKILEQKVTPESAVISLKALNQGMYLYKLESDNFYTSGKIIKK
ncbi:MAG: T9SS type A sorting domain-containing protein, partial [Methylotenera sp.]|nr:T9SS type A sorting domain-containing protein [Flavobacterium sp.]